MAPFRFKYRWVSELIMEVILKEIQAEDEPDMIDEIILDKLKQNSISKQDKVLLEKYQEVVNLSMNQMGLTSLANFPNLPHLLKLELNDNSFGGNELENITHLKELRQLSLCRSGIKSVEDLAALKKLENLLSLEFTESPITGVQNYPQIVFKYLPQTKIIDGKNEYGEEVELDYGSSEDVGEEFFDEEGSFEEDQENSQGQENNKKRKRENQENSDEESEEQSEEESEVEEEKKKPEKKRKTN